MSRSFAAAVLALLILAGGLLAIDFPATILKIDSDKGIVSFRSFDQQRDAKVDPSAKFLDEDGKELPGGLKSEKLKEGTRVTVSVERIDEERIVKAIKLGTKGLSVVEPVPEPGITADVAQLKPLIDMGKNDDYRGFRGGLYPDAKNTRPTAHEQAGIELAKKIQPLDAEGKPSPDGKIVLLSIGFSNTVQCFMGFMTVAQEDKGLNPRLVLVNGAQGGRSAFMIQNPDDGTIGEKYWKEWVMDHLKSQGVTPAQVQAIWLKETDAALGPDQLKALGVKSYDPPTKQPFPKSAMTLQAELRKIVLVLPRFFPNAKLVYLSSRSFGGWAKREGNKEPFSYETGYAVKWLIEDQLKGDPGLNYDPAKGSVKAPWLSWGPYLWASGDKKRTDGFSSQLDDFREDDRMHHAPQGQRKMGTLLLQFFKNDPTSKGWFVKQTP